MEGLIHTPHSSTLLPCLGGGGPASKVEDVLWSNASSATYMVGGNLFEKKFLFPDIVASPYVGDTIGAYHASVIIPSYVPAENGKPNGALDKIEGLLTQFRLEILEVCTGREKMPEIEDPLPTLSFCQVPELEPCMSIKETTAVP